MKNIILIPGSGHGGWGYDPIANRLRDLGHNVFALTLSGLDHEKQETKAINLDTHIQDVLDVIELNQLESVYLVGHSYGGMVITGVADRTKSQVEGLFYIDAVLPKPGQRQWDTLDREMLDGFIASSIDGINIHPSPEFKAFRPRVMPHPLATMMQPLHYSESSLDVKDKTYIYAEKFFGIPDQVSPFKAIYQELSKREDWHTYSLPYGHDIFEEAPEVVFALMVEALGRL